MGDANIVRSEEMLSNRLKKTGHLASHPQVLLSARKSLSRSFAACYVRFHLLLTCFQLLETLRESLCVHPSRFGEWLTTPCDETSSRPWSTSKKVQKWKISKLPTWFVEAAAKDLQSATDELEQIT
eukprot:652806-Amphidinium_carterae.1